MRTVLLTVSLLCATAIPLPYSAALLAAIPLPRAATLLVVLPLLRTGARATAARSRIVRKIPRHCAQMSLLASVRSPSSLFRPRIPRIHPINLPPLPTLRSFRFVLPLIFIDPASQRRRHPRPPRGRITVQAATSMVQLTGSGRNVKCLRIAVVGGVPASAAAGKNVQLVVGVDRLLLFDERGPRQLPSIFGVVVVQARRPGPGLVLVPRPRPGPAVVVKQGAAAGTARCFSVRTSSAASRA